MAGLVMSRNFRTEIERARLIGAVGIDKARWLAPIDPPFDYVPAVSEDELKALDGRIPVRSGLERSQACAATEQMGFWTCPVTSHADVIVLNRRRRGPGRPSPPGRGPRG